jgi:Na+/H+ antiporter NhaB
MRSAVQYVGFTVMPLVGSALSVLGTAIHEAGGVFLNQYNLPALFMVLMSVVAVVLLRTVFDSVRTLLDAIVRSTIRRCLLTANRPFQPLRALIFGPQWFNKHVCVPVE